MPEREPGAAPSPETKPPFQRAIDLANQYGGIDKIPDEELNKIGYGRKDDGSIAPMEVIEKSKQITEAEEAEKEASLEQKIKNAPFGEITVSLASQEMGFRRLNEQNIKKLCLEADTIYSDFEELRPDTMGEKILELVPTNKKFFQLFQEFQQYLNLSKKQSEIAGLEHDELIYMVFGVSGLEVCLEPARDAGFVSSMETFANYSEEMTGGELIISSSQAEKLHQKLERDKGTAADQNELRKIFYREQGEPFPIYHSIGGEAVQRDYPKLAAYSREHGLSTIFKVGTHFFANLLETHDLPTLSQALEQSQSPDGALELLKTQRDESLSATHQELETLRKQIKAASIEQKKTLSGRLKGLTEKFSTQKSIVDGLIEYYDFPQLGAEILSRRIKQIQDFLIANKGDESEVDFVLDARPDSDLDQDPGFISGDCTAGEPLPFADPKIPVYNVKVFDNSKEHIGNIYLLMTQTEDGKPVWHLDAIQIPSYNVDWDQAIPSIITEISREAQKKGVSSITVNDSKESISNYDYIGQAAETYWQKTGSHQTNIEIPEVDEEKFSSFQGTGRVRILWEK